MPSATTASNTSSLSKSPYSEMDSSMTHVQPTSVSHDSVPTSEDTQFEAPDAADMQPHVVTQEEQRPAPVPRSHPAADVHKKYPAPPSYYAPQPRKTKHHYSPASLPHVISSDPSFEIPSLEKKESEDSVYSYKNYEASHAEHKYAISSKASFDKMESDSKRKEAPESEASEQKEKKAKSSHPQYHYGHYPHYPYYYHYYPPHHASAAAAHASAAASASAAVATSGHAYAWPYPAHHAYSYAYPGYYSHHPAAKPSKGKKSGSHPASSKTVAKKRPEVKKRKAENVTITKKEAKPAVAAAKIQFPPRDITINDHEDKKETLSSGARERRARKNAQSRMRAAKLKETIAMIKQKRPEERTAEEAAKLATFEERRLKKNCRSRQRAMERKSRVSQITRKPEEEWTKEEKEFMHETLVAKYKKNEGDRLRRKRMRESGMSVADTSYSGSTSLDDCPDSHFKPSHFKFQPVDISSSQQNRAESQAPITPKSPHFNDIEHDDFAPNMFEMTPKQSSQEKDFMSNFVFPSPSKDEERFFSSPTLELCADTSILDQSLEEIAYSPRNAQPYVGASREHEMTSPLNIHPLDLPRRTKPTSDTIYDIGQDWRGDDDFARQEAIAVSFSMDEPLELA